jgi:hypothetical protein
MIPDMKRAVKVGVAGSRIALLSWAERASTKS